MSESYHLAVYDFRSKQEYIYKTNKVKEIMGASKIIELAYKDAIEGYNKEYGGIILTGSDGDFSMSEFENDKKAVACELYEGGGNLLMLFKNNEELTRFNNHLSWWLIENAPGLTPICGTAMLNEKESYSENTKRVFDNLDKYKRLAPPIAYADILPFTQIDRRTTQPVAHKDKREEISICSESRTKINKYNDEIAQKEKYAKQLDDLITKKGEESLLALIYVDGNALGERVKKATEGLDFEKGVTAMRELSKTINKVFVKDTLEAIEKELGELKDKDLQAMRKIIGGGDEITLICNAREALEVATAYFASLESYNVEHDESFAACMGIAIFHASAPFSDIYKIAEQCCESGKKKTRGGNENNSFFDAFFCHSAITGTMKELRKSQYGDKTEMPYEIGSGEWDKFVAAGKMFKSVKRTNIKALRDTAFLSETDFELELMRVKANAKGEVPLTSDENDIKLFCDIATFYDIWFTGRENDGKN